MTDRIAKRSLYGLASQALSSAGNLALSLSVARSVSATSFGAWALAYTAYMFALHLNRAVAGTPLTLDGDPHEPPTRDSVRGALSAALATGALASTVLLATAMIIGGASLRASCLVFAGLLPILLAQDLLRYAFFRTGQPARAAAIDLVWLGIQLLGSLGLILSDRADAISVTLTWGLGALVSALCGAANLKVLPSPSQLLLFMRKHSAAQGKMIVDSVVAGLSTYLIPTVVALAAGLSAAGSLRAGQTLMGGVNIVVMGLVPILTLEARKALNSGASPMRVMTRWSLVLAAFSVPYGLLLLLIPERIGLSLLGDSWAGASALLVPLVLQSLARGPYTAAPPVLKAMGNFNAMLRLRFATAVPSLAAPAAGAVWNGATGAAWGLLVGAILVSVQSFLTLRASRALNPSSPADGSLR